MQRQRLFLSSSHTTSTARLRLLTYPMALAQPHATVPLLQRARKNTEETHNTAKASFRSPALSVSVKQRGVERESLFSSSGDVMIPRRWLRGPEEICVASIRRSGNVNRINTYVATYKFDDPQWAPLLLPEVITTYPAATDDDVMEKNAEGASSSPPIVPPSSSHMPDTSNNLPGIVSINHNKLISLECMSRHINFSLRHIVQKGHAMYLLHHTQHSILQPKGVVEQSFVTCAYGIRGERLRTDIIHVGPLNASDILEVHEESQGHGHVRCVFNFQKSGVTRGVVAISQVEGYGTWFQRKPMLWQRSRRIGALQSQLGALSYDLAMPHDVGKRQECEVSLLAPHMRFFSNGGNGVEAVGIIASTQIAQQERLYLGEFEAPAITALDAVQQLAHASALRCRLVTPSDHTRKRQETLLPVSWATRTPPPYVPLEADLPFKLQMSRPAVFHNDSVQQHGVYPTGGTIGSPFMRGAPLMMFEYNLHQGVDHYVFDDAPSARPMKWWSQKSNLPYSGYMYFARSEVVDHLTPTEEVPNPLEPAARRKPLHALVPPSKSVQRRIHRYKKKLQESENKKKSSSKDKGV